MHSLVSGYLNGLSVCLLVCVLVLNILTYTLLSKHTPLQANKQNERETVQWRLLKVYHWLLRPDIVS